MSIDKVEITNAQGNLLTLSLQDTSNGYVVEDIDGLDPVKATIVTSNFATMDGQQYQASSRDPRNIVVKLSYAPNDTINETIRSLRSRLYQYFMPGVEVSLVFYMSDGLSVNIVGRVESCEAPLFAQEPEMNISIMCFNPDFVNTEDTALYGVFDTANTAGYTFQYAGTVPSGLSKVNFFVNTSMSDFTIYHTPPSGVVRTMQVSVPLVPGDVIDMRTIKGEKHITLDRGGVQSSLLWAVSPQSNWVQLEPGTNTLYMHVTGSTIDSISATYYERYGGL